ALLSITGQPTTWHSLLRGELGTTFQPLSSSCVRTAMMVCVSLAAQTRDAYCRSQTTSRALNLSMRATPSALVALTLRTVALKTRAVLLRATFWFFTEGIRTREPQPSLRTRLRPLIRASVAAVDPGGCGGQTVSASRRSGSGKACR